MSHTLTVDMGESAGWAVASALMSTLSDEACAQEGKGQGCWLRQPAIPGADGTRSSPEQG